MKSTSCRRQIKINHYNLTWSVRPGFPSKNCTNILIFEADGGWGQQPNQTYFLIGFPMKGF